MNNGAGYGIGIRMQSDIKSAFNRGAKDMVRHVIIWELKDEFSGEEAAKIKKEIKEGLENLAGKIPGLKEIKVYTEPLESSNCDLMLDSLFEDEKALKGYAVHPAHVEVADNIVRSNTSRRSCIDFEI